MARIELVDEVQMDALIRYAKLDYPKQPALFFEFHGTEAGVKEQAEMVAALGEEYGIGGFRWTQKAEERSKLWEARHNVLYSCLALRPGAKALATDAWALRTRIVCTEGSSTASSSPSRTVAPMSTARSGMMMWNAAPMVPSARRSSPPWARTSSDAMASPRPVPPERVEPWNASNR